MMSQPNVQNQLHARSLRTSPGRPERIGVKRPLRWVFALFVFSIPFQAVDTGFTQTASVSKIIGYLLLLLALIYPGVCFRRFPLAVVCFMAYVLELMVYAPFQAGIYQPGIRYRLFTLVQVLVMFIISYNLLRQPRMVGLMLGSFSAACAVLAALNLAGVTASAVKLAEGERVTTFGEDLNTAGSVFGLGLLAIVGLVYGRMRRGRSRNFLAWVMLPLLSLSVVRTGSRGALVALAGGLLVFLLRRGSVWLRFRNFMIVAAAFVVIVVASLSMEMTRKRWEATFERGSMAGRERIYPEAWKLFLERPILGWGPVANFYALGKRLLLPTRDTHNLFLWLLTEVGILGSIPYLAGLYLCVRTAWRSRAGPEGVLPLAMLVSALLINMSLTWIEAKPFWLVLALALASGSQVGVRSVRRPVPRSVPGSRPRVAVASQATASL